MDQSEFGPIKKFDKQLMPYDVWARELTKALLASYGPVDNENLYGPDLVLSDNSVVEVEVKAYAFKSVLDFPFKTVDIPFRKNKFFKSYEGKYYLFSAQTAKHIYIDFKKIIKCPIIIKNTKYTIGERFFSIPKELFSCP